MMSISLRVVIALILGLGTAHATVVNPSGGDDTAAIQKVCTAGQVVELVKGTYHVSSVTCKDIVGKDPANRCYFWYEGVVCPTTMVGFGTAGAPMIVCPSSGCSYANFAVSLPPGAAGIGTAGTIHGLTIDGMMIADVGSGQSGSCVDMTAGQNNQELLISNSTFIHCGAATSTSWCINAGVTSDSSITGTSVLANCGAGGLLISYGYGWDIRPFRIEDQYNGPCVAWVNGGDGSIDVGGGFDQCLYDISLGGTPGSPGGSVYLTLGKIFEDRLAPGGFTSIDIEGQVALLGGIVFTAPSPSATFYVNPSLPNNTFWACGMQVVGPGYADAYSQQVISPFVNTSCN